MGRISLLLDGQTKEKQIRLVSPSYLTDERIDELNDFLKNNETSKDNSYVEMLSNYLNQMAGYFNQLLIHSEGLIDQNLYDKYRIKSEELGKEELNKTKESCENLLKEYFALYSEVNKDLNEVIRHNEEKKQLAQAISTANDLLIKIDQNYVESDSSIDSSLLPIVELYKKGITEQGNNQLATLTLLIDEEKRLLSREKGAIKSNVSPEIRKVNLFDSLNDQIISKEFKKHNDLVYAKYELKDGSSYYAIIKDSTKVLKENEEFATFTSFEMNRKSVEQNLGIIVKNIAIYYDLNEYTRYVEMLYKNQMSKEIEQALDQYKQRLLSMENVLKGQLSFIDDIAPILNRKSSEKYPGIVYTDTLVKDFYPTELNEQRKLMIRLADDTVSNDITNYDVLVSMYGDNITNELVDEFSTYKKEDKVQDSISEVTTTQQKVNSNQMITNYQKISDYLKIRKEELNRISSGETNVKITENDDSIYQNVNTILNLNTAASISDRQYNDGQGIYAITQYLKTGEANRFTSNENARMLATKVKPNSYTALLMENMIKSFAGSGKKSNEDGTYFDRMQQILLFVKDELSMQNFSALDMKNKLLNNDNLLAIAIKNFDYDYIDPSSENSKLFEQAIEIGINNNNSSALRIKTALTDIRNLGKSELIQLQEQSQYLTNR